MADPADASEKPPAEEGAAPPTAPASAGARKNWKKGAKLAKDIAVSCAKVAQENKIGETPTGWFREAAMSLQRHIAEEGHGTAKEAAGSAAFENPEVDLFRRVRTAAGFPPARYYATLGLQEGQSEPSLRLIGANSAAGRSGAFFFLSPDQQLIAKTCNKAEWILLQRILKPYTEHVEAARERADRRRASSAIGLGDGLRGFGDTLLPRYLGLYRFEVGEPAQQIRVVIMSNVFAGSQIIATRYDLKGSTHGRKASAKERKKSTPVLKDLDWKASEEPMRIGKDERDLILAALKADAQFLSSQRLIDYSLLMGVHTIQAGPSVSGGGMSTVSSSTSSLSSSMTTGAGAAYESSNVVKITDGDRLAYIGIVDVLTPYKMKKRAETIFLGWLFGCRDISCQPPGHYARRFLDFVSTYVFEERAQIESSQSQLGTMAEESSPVTQSVVDKTAAI